MTILAIITNIITDRNEWRIALGMVLDTAIIVTAVAGHYFHG